VVAAAITVVVLGLSRQRHLASRAGSRARPSAVEDAPTALLHVPGAARHSSKKTSHALLSVLGVLRRPATLADALRESEAGNHPDRPSHRQEVYANYVAAGDRGVPYYVWPVLTTACADSQVQLDEKHDHSHDNVWEVPVTLG